MTKPEIKAHLSALFIDRAEGLEGKCFASEYMWNARQRELKNRKARLYGIKPRASKNKTWKNNKTH